MSENQNPLKPTEIRQICLDNGLIIKDPQWQLLEEWADLLLNYNQEINLVSRKETDLFGRSKSCIVSHCWFTGKFHKVWRYVILVQEEDYRHNFGHYPAGSLSYIG
ncbi:MAG: hypothetical protein CM1200mP28_05700 [Deltaproteobacteria bacterium]|nr:MAG: hypothetical protein CM1200mP28_05700 [Deltaproteobacteria bacterium]